jgi:hypothetical protein
LESADRLGVKRRKKTDEQGRHQWGPKQPRCRCACEQEQPHRELVAG